MPEIKLATDLSTVDAKVDILDIAGKLGIDTAAGKESLRYALANCLLLDRKQKDYGPHNIAKFGSQGCLMRMSDKMERLIHIFNSTGRRKKVLNESVTDSFRDLSNYGNIGLMVEDSKWPKE